MIALSKGVLAMCRSAARALARARREYIASPAFTAVVLDTAAALRPLLDWGWALVDGGV